MYPSQALPTPPLALLLSLALMLGVGMARAADPAPVAKAIEEYMDFTEYGSSIIWPEQIPEDDWKKITVIDARDATQFAKEHIPGAINIEWRQIPGRRGEITKDKLVLIYCNSGSLSAQAVFALRLLGWDNVKVLQDGFEGWKAKGGFEANKRASRPAGH
jgi:rhodanese-related sulfurtransferase